MKYSRSYVFSTNHKSTFHCQSKLPGIITRQAETCPSNMSLRYSEGWSGQLRSYHRRTNLPFRCLDGVWINEKTKGLNIVSNSKYRFKLKILFQTQNIVSNSKYCFKLKILFRTQNVVSILKILLSSKFWKYHMRIII